MKNLFNEYYSNNEVTILKDVNRTYSCINNKSHFKKVYSILYAYCKRNPRIGYLQGFNFIVDFFLRQEYSEEETFWMLVYILEDVLNENFYVNFFPVFANIKIFKFILFHINIEMFNFFALKNFDIFLILHKWFLLHFIDSPNNSFITWFLDYFFLEGDLATTKASFLIFAFNEDKLLECTDIYSLNKAMSTLIHFIQDETLFKTVYNDFYISNDVYYYVQNFLIKQEKSNSFILIDFFS